MADPLDRGYVSPKVLVAALVAYLIVFLGVVYLAGGYKERNEPTRIEVDGGPVTPDQLKGVVKLGPTEYCFNRAEWISLNPGERWCE